MQPARATEQVGHMAVRAIDLPRVLVVSDVLLYRDGVAGGLAAAGMLVVVGAATGHEALVAMSCDAADAIVIDASTPDILGVARALRMTWPRVPVIGFGISGDATGLACAEAGLTGFVGREGTLADLAVTVQRALAGEVGCTPQFAALLCQRVAMLAAGGSTGNATAPLTRREREIANLVAEGLSNKEIAIELRIGPATVKNHIHNILEKLEVPRRGAIGSRLRATAVR